MKKVTYTEEYRRCGKPSCRCTRGQRHGPYLYASWREGARRFRVYLGKVFGDTRALAPVG